VALAGLWLVGAQIAFNAGHVVAVVAPVSSLAVATAGGLLAIHLAERRDPPAARARVRRL
jgi:hypothetical protein